MPEKIINLEQLANGALKEQMDGEVQKIFDNIYDPNTKAETARKLTVTFTFKPDKDREIIGVTMNVKPTPAPVLPTETKLYIEKDLKTGKVIASEIKKQIPGQMEMEIQQEETHENNDKIIDLKKANGGNK
jgi:hypothetical protein